MTIPSDGNDISLKWFLAGTRHEEYIFLCYFYILFLARITSLKIDGVVNCLSFAVNMASFKYTSAQQSEMLCTKYIMYQKRSKFVLQMDDTIDESMTFFSAQNLLWHRQFLLVMVYWVFRHWKYNKANTGHHTCIRIVYY